MDKGHCGYTWWSPFIVRDPFGTTLTKRVEQVCVLPKDHDGNHRSITKVIAPNQKGT